MVFSSLSFLLFFLPCVLIVYHLLPRVLKNAWLVIASIAFYAFGEPKFVFLFLLEIVWNWALAILIARAHAGSAKKLLLGLCLSGDLIVLGLFKYSSFFVQSINGAIGTDFPLPGFILPIGISFYTFQEISYVVDVYRGEEARKNPVDVALYLSFFPQLVAGPIVRWREIAPQLSRRRSSWSGVSDGFQRFCLGLCKKVLLADQLAILVTHVFDRVTKPESLAAPILWMAAIAFWLQIYFDFSGYSDMAIGLGAMLGFRIPENFRQPYLAKTATEFWRRWHMTLSGWFRDYVYVPLGGSRGGPAKTIRNLLLVWVLTGLWHGAGWTFLLWGLLWGVLLILEKFLIRPEERGKTFRLFYRLLTVLLMILFWVPFRASTVQHALVLLGHLFSPAAWALSSVQLPAIRMWCHEMWLYLLVGTLLVFDLPQRLFTRLVPGAEQSAWVDMLRLALLGVCVCVSLSFLVNGNYSPFLYFQF